MRYAVLFILLAVGCVELAVTRGGPYWILMWPAASSATVAACYAGAGPGPLGKRADGTIRLGSIAVLFPYFAYAWTVWRTRWALTGEAVANEVAPGIWVGRRPSTRDLPVGVTHVVDLTAEFPAGRVVRLCPGYLSVPTLDGAATDPARMAATLALLESTAGIAYIHCAFGHGRSAALAAALMVRRGLAADVAEAEAKMRRHRPGIRLKTSQRLAAAEAVRKRNC